MLPLITPLACILVCFKVVHVRSNDEAVCSAYDNSYVLTSKNDTQLNAVLNTILPQELNALESHHLPCTWPACAPKCDACHKLAGYCWPLRATKNFSYRCRRWPGSECRLGLCLCPLGTCLWTFPNKTRMCVDDDLLCFAGAETPNTTVSAWTWRLTLPIFALDIPEPLAQVGYEMEDGFNTFFKRRQNAVVLVRKWVENFGPTALLIPSIFILLGVAFSVLICLFSFCSVRHVPSIGRLFLKRSEHCLCPAMTVVAIVACGLAVCSVLTQWFVAQRTLDLIYEQVDILDDNFNRVVLRVAQITEEGYALGKFLDGVPPSCTWLVADYVNESVVGANSFLTKYNALACELLALLRQISTVWDSGYTVANVFSSATYFSWIPELPNIVVAVVCCMVVLLAACTRCVYHPEFARWARNVDCCCLSLMTLAMWILGAWWLLLGCTNAAFCINAGHNVVSVFESRFQGVLGALVSKAARYYVFGNELNPILVLLGKMRQILKEFTHVLEATPMLRLLDPVKWACPAFDTSEVFRLLDFADETARVAEEMLSAENVYPIYDGIASNVCNSMVSVWAWLIVFSVVSSLLVLPCLAFCVHADLMWWEHVVREREKDNPHMPQWQPLSDFLEDERKIAKDPYSLLSDGKDESYGPKEVI